GQGGDAPGRQVGAGEHRDDARARLRGGRVDFGEPGASVGRAGEHRVGLARGGEVVGVAAAAGDEADVLAAADGLTDHAVHRGVLSYAFAPAASSTARTMLW